MKNGKPLAKVLQDDGLLEGLDGKLDLRLEAKKRTAKKKGRKQ